jgi:NADH-quinone oxidoreductase subunit M
LESSGSFTSLSSANASSCHICANRSGHIDHAGSSRPNDCTRCLLLTLLTSVFLFLGFDSFARGFQFVFTIPISTELRLNFALGVDGLSLLMILLGAIVLLAAVWSTGEVEHHENAFYACLLLIAGGAIGAFASLNLFFFYAFHELALIPTFLLIGIWGTGNRRAAAWKVTIYLALGSVILLVGLIMLYRAVPSSARSLDLRVLQAAASAGQIAPALQSSIYLVLLIGFGILISLVPFHTWAPEAYASAPAPAAMLHAGVLKKIWPLRLAPDRGAIPA